MLKTFCVAALVIALALSAKPAAAIQPVYFYNSHTNMVLQPLNGSKVQGVAIVQQPFNAFNSGPQEWLFINSGGGNFHFENAISGLCLDARGGATNGTPVQQWTCNGISNENWEPPTNAKGQSIGPVTSRVSGTKSHCLDVPGGQTTAGLAMQIYTCNGTVSQLWELKPASAVVVPNVLNLSEIAATNKITLYDLTPVVAYANKCTAPGLVIAESPIGSLEQPNAPVDITVDSGTNCPPK